MSKDSEQYIIGIDPAIGISKSVFVVTTLSVQEDEKLMESIASELLIPDPEEAPNDKEDKMENKDDQTT